MSVSDDTESNASGDHGLAYKAQSSWPSGVKVTSWWASSEAQGVSITQVTLHLTSHSKSYLTLATAQGGANKA